LPDIPISSNAFIEAIKQIFSRRQRLLDLNLKAFEEGRKIGRKLLSD